MSLTRNTKQTQAEEVVYLEDVDRTKIVEVTESYSEEDHQMEKAGDCEDNSADCELIWI